MLSNISLIQFRYKGRIVQISKGKVCLIGEMRTDKIIHAFIIKIIMLVKLNIYIFIKNGVPFRIERNLGK